MPLDPKDAGEQSAWAPVRPPFLHQEVEHREADRSDSSAQEGDAQSPGRLIDVLAVEENDSDDAEEGCDPEHGADRLPRQGGSQERHDDDLEPKDRHGHRDISPFQGEKLGDLTCKETEGDQSGLPKQDGINFGARP